MEVYRYVVPNIYTPEQSVFEVQTNICRKDVATI